MNRCSLRKFSELIKSSLTQRVVLPCGDYTPEINDNEFVVFLKPESLCLTQNDNLERLISIVVETALYHQINFVRGVVISPQERVNHHLIDRNYNILNDISRNGTGSLSPSLKNSLSTFCKSNNYLNYPVFGGDQYLALNKNLRAQELQYKIDKSGTIKLGSGAYLSVLAKERSLILNGFYPYQREWLNHPNAPLLAFHAAAKIGWSTIRENFVGGIVPEQSTLRSIRRTLFEHRAVLGLGEINIGKNLVHVSPGPLEALKQIELFFNDRGSSPHADSQPATILERQLLKCGWSNKRIEVLFSNPVVETIDPIRGIIDATEDMNTVTFLEKISSQPL